MTLDVARRNSRAHEDPEKKVEEYLEKRINDLSGLAWKFVSPGTTGVPDRVVMLDGMICFAELKRPKGGRLSDTQKWRVKQINQQRIKAYVIKNLEQVDLLVDSMMRGVLPDEI